jgi:hypothetical protein|tara:strand:+ start:1511 stop:1858 length:348 start_codon:yes stop_codon:yes gene_type:complete
MQIATFNDFLGEHPTSEILCAMKREVVRRFRRMPDGSVELDALSDKIVVPADTVVMYEPWCMDRGSLVWIDGERGTLKACTEFDVLRFPNGDENSIQPADGAPQHEHQVQVNFGG